MKFPPLRCDQCGKFISEPADSYTPFGGYLDVEPPESVLLCEKCVEENKKEIRDNNRIWNHWRPANYEFELAVELGFVRIDGLWEESEEE